MMDMAQLVESFTAREILITQNDGELKIQAPKGAVKAEDIALIREHKARLLAWLMDNDGDTTTTVTIPRRGADDTAIPLSYSQQTLWFLDQLNGQSQQFNMAVALQVDGTFDLAAANRAFAEVVQRHEVLRTVYEQVQGQACQRVLDDVEFAIEFVDLSELPEAQKAQQTAQHISRHRDYGFNLSEDLMLQVCYVLQSRQDEQAKGVLLLNVHHIASDGWSIDILLNEFVTLYQYHCGHGGQALPPLALQYADFACWQRRELDEAALAKKLSFWEQQLADIQPLHSLSLDYGRPEQKQFEGGQCYGELPKEVASGLKRLAEDNQLTVFMLLHAAFALLLSRHSHNQDIVIGTPAANRSHDQLAGLIGFFVNPTVLRVNTGQATLGDYLAHVRQVNLDTLAHQDVPFDQLVERLAGRRSTAHTPLFQIVLTSNSDFGVGQGGRENLSLPQLNIAQLRQDKATVKSDIELDIRVSDGGLTLHWVYDKCLFKPERIARFDGHLCQLLEQMVALTRDTAPADIALGSLTMMNHSEQDELGVLFRGKAADYAKHNCVQELIEQHARQTPDNTAVVLADGQISYTDLNERANRLAHYLLENHQVRPDALVGICLDRSIDMVVAILAILKAGGAYVPLDPAYPAERLAYMVADAKPVVVLTKDAIWQTLGVDAVTVDVETLTLDGYGSDNIDKANLGLEPQHLAYVIYTSGSTGNPKGVMISHRALIHSTTCRNNTYRGLQAFMLVSSFSFDSSVAGIFSALTSGARLCIAGTELQNDLHRFIDHLVAWQISHFSAVPGFYGAMLDCLDMALVDKQDLNLAGVVVAGEECAPSLADKHHRIFDDGQVGLYNEYGPTEATVWSTVAKLLPAEAVTIGKPIDNCQLYVLGQDMTLAPLGCTGELYIGGESLARGYLNHSEMTDAKFVDNPFYQPGLPGASRKLYRTGDLVKGLADGNLAFIGRQDQQVKIRGFRVELGEIAHQINLLAPVDSSMVQVYQGGSERKSLVAWVKPVQGCELSDSEVSEYVRRELASRLPEHMVPSVVVVLAVWPVTANGKIDKTALPEPQFGQSEAGLNTPQGPVEQQLHGLWCKLLKLPADRVSTTANFFELGGDSILSIQMVAHGARLGLHFTAKDLFEAQNIRQLALKVGANLGDEQADSAPVSGQQPLLPIARRFFADEVDVHHFNQAILLKLDDAMDEQNLVAVLAALYARHDALSIRYDKLDGQWQGHYRPERDNLALAKASLQMKELSQHTARDYEQFVDTFQASFDLQEGALLKVAHICLPQQMSEQGPQYRLLLVAHHLAVDAVSWRIILDNLGQWYKQQTSGVALQPGNKTSSYQQWGEFLIGYGQSEAVQQQREYWLDTFEPAVVNLADWCGAANDTADSGESQQLQCRVGQDITQSLLSEANQAYRTTTVELLLGALLLAVSRLTGQSALRVDMESHGREALSDDIDLSQTVGWFTAAWPLLLSQPNGAEDIGQLLNSVKTRFRAVPQKGIGFGLLQQQDDAFAGLAPREMVFNYLGQFDQVADTRGFAAADEYSGQVASTRRKRWHQLTLNSYVVDAALTLDLKFPQGRYPQPQMQALLSGIEQALTDIHRHCQATEVGAYVAADFPLATVSDSDLVQWQARYGTIADLYPATGMQQGLLFHGLMEKGSYISQLVLSFDDLNVARFKAAWAQVVARHNALRTVFVGLEDMAAHQLVLENMPLDWQEYDLSVLGEDEQQQQIDAQRRQIREQGFDHQSGPLMSLVLFKVSATTHKLIWSHHHANLDGWCLPIIFAELVECYRALAADEPARLPQAPDYNRYARYLKSKDSETSLQYWDEVLADVDVRTPLPMKGAGLESAQPEDMMQTLQFDDAQSQALQDFAKRAKTTVNILLQGAWSWLLSSYGGCEQVVFGATTSGRAPEVTDIDKMVGLFINTVPVVVNAPGQAGLIDWLQQLHGAQQNAERHAWVPLHQIQQRSQVGQGLFDSLIIFENYPVDELVSSRAEQAVFKARVDASDESTNYPITLKARFDKQLAIDLEILPGVFGAAQLQLLVEQLGEVMMAMAGADESTTLADIHCQQAEQQQQIIEQLRGPDINSEFIGLHSRFEQQARLNPERVALRCGEQQLTYAELDGKANQLARYLLQSGNAGPDCIIGLCLERSVELVIAMLAVLKSGSAYVPLDPGYPEARLQYVMNDAAMTLLLTRQSLLSHISTTAHNVIAVDALALAQYESTALTDVAVQREQLAYVIYTSGSTGNPKGVMIEHGAADNFIAAMTERLGCQQRKGAWLALTTVSFDIALLEIFGPLSGGQCCVLAQDEQLLQPDTLIGLIEQYDIRYLQATPTLWQMFKEADWQGNANLVALCGGEPLPLGLAQYLQQCTSQLYNCYGPTEATVWSLVTPVDASMTDSGKITIGQSLAGYGHVVLDSQNRLLPKYAVGELGIYGHSLARGYLNQPQLSDDKFVSVGLSAAQAKQRVYKTGDLVRLLDDGQIEFMGRADEQIKLRGHRIEVAEIVAQLQSIDAVESAVVMLRSAQRQLVAYVKPRQMPQEAQHGEFAQAIKATLRSQLADYMMPGSFVLVEQWPTTDNGKINKRALEQTYQPVLQEAFKAPETEVQKALAECWSALLDIPVAQIGISADFFELGGHSLATVRLQSEINKTWGLNLTIEDIYTTATIAGQATLIEHQQWLSEDAAAMGQGEEGFEELEL